MAGIPDLHRLRVARSARVYLVGDRSATEVWFVLHGFGQLAASFAEAFAPVAETGRLVVAPEALNHYYTDHRAKRVGATWMTSEDRAAEIADYVAYLDHVAAEFLPESAASRVEVHGFSQGAATASRWVALGAVRPARLVLWGGEVPPDPPLESYRDRLNAADLTLVVGDRDQFISAERIGREAARLDAAGVRHTLHRFAGGHVVNPEVLVRLAGR